MLHWFKKKEHTCQLCFCDKRKQEAASQFSEHICRECWNSERLRLRSNNRSKRNKRYPTGRITTREWLTVLQKCNWSCANCNIKGRNKLTLDHILSINAGGTNTPDNVQPLCVPCHEKKDGYQRRPFWWLRRLMRRWRRYMWKRRGISLQKIRILE
jgi:hypothetical protein